MGRKKQYICKVTSKDADMLKAFARVGYLNADMIKRQLCIADRRVINFAKDKFIEKCSYFEKDTKISENIYRLTDKGQKFIERELGIKWFYRSSSAAHDLALASKYLSLSDKERDTWKTEAEIRDIFKETLDSMIDNERFEEIEKMLAEHQISPTDAYYISNQGESMGVEIVTSSYGNSEIQAKSEFCSHMNLQAEFIKV